MHKDSPSTVFKVLLRNINKKKSQKMLDKLIFTYKCSSARTRWISVGRGFVGEMEPIPADFGIHSG